MNSHWKACLLSVVLWLLSVVSYGQALGLAELMKLRRMTQQHATKILQAKGWTLHSEKPLDSTGFSQQLWTNKAFGSGDTTRVHLFLYHSQERRRKNYLRYVNFAGSIGKPAFTTYHFRRIHGKRKIAGPALIYAGREQQLDGVKSVLGNEL